MRTSIITIGNSRGLRLPKLALEESELGPLVELTYRRGEIKITPPLEEVPETALMAERVLVTDWNRPEEDKAWASLK